MSLENQELGGIYAEIQAEFHNSAEILVSAISGDPPNQYEVVYNIPCTTQDEQGNITITLPHTVIISIPFGFPHFPPSCKPKSPIFHPDFDTAAICLSGFWNHDRNIPQLIRHIASMLRGDIYSKNNAFNEQAARWFNDHSDQLPFADTEIPVTKKTEETPFTLTLESSDKTEETEEVDILEDEDFIDDFEFPKDLSESTPVSDMAELSRSEPIIQVNLDKLHSLTDRKRFHTLESELRTAYGELNFPEKAGLLEIASKALKKAELIYQEATESENQANAEKALQLYKAVEKTVVDFPNIEKDILRAEQSVQMLHGINGIGEKGSSRKSDTDSLSEENDFIKPPPKRSVVKTRGPFFEETSKRHVNIIPYVLAGGILCIVATFTYFYFSLSNQLSEARQLYSECTSNFAAKNFQVAEKACNMSLDSTRSIFLIHQKEVSDLQNNIRRIMNSEDMRQGLLGNVLYNEKYVSKTTLAAHQSLQELKVQGEAHLKESSWDAAAASFQKSLELSRRLEDIPPNEILDIEQKLKYAAFRSMLSVAENHIAAQDWASASAILTELQDQIGVLPVVEQTTLSNQINTLLAKSRFTNLRDQADRLFSKSDWAGAVALFQKAAEAGQALSVTENQELADIKENIAKAELYSTINDGNSSFASGKWNSAIEKYKQAIEILRNNRGIINLQEMEESTFKLNSIILQSAIIRDRQISDRNREKGDNATAITYLDKVISTIQSSDFTHKYEFQEILAETQRAKQKLQDDIFINSKKQYLLDNFIDLFLTNYPAASRQTLRNPIATFEKKLEHRYLFKLQCTESGRGRPLKLIMFYVYDPRNDSWSFYSNN